MILAFIRLRESVFFRDFLIYSHLHFIAVAVKRLYLKKRRRRRRKRDFRGPIQRCANCFARDSGLLQRLLVPRSRTFLSKPSVTKIGSGMLPSPRTYDPMFFISLFCMILLLGKPPALPEDFWSSTIPGVNTEQRDKKNYSPGRGQAAKPRAQALGNVGINEVALQGRYSLFRPSRALYIMPNISQGLRPWALLLGPFRAISGTAALSGTKIKPPALPSLYPTGDTVGIFFPVKPGMP
jgi:hypothetical protein